MNALYVDERQVAELTSIPVKTLQNHRAKGTGFPYRKFGRHVRYLKSEIIEIMESGLVQPLIKGGCHNG